MHNLNLNYNITSFIQDLTKIKAETFKKRTIYSTFQHARIWLISYKTAIAKIKIYTLLEALVKLLTLPRTLTKF